MAKLIYKVVYTPSLDDGYGAEEKGINFLCSDGKIHIRLRDYDHEEVIHGFINKLTYLLTYEIKRLEQVSTNGSDIISAYQQGGHYKELEDFIRNVLHEDNFTGIKISENYRRIKNYNKLGSFAKGTFPVKKLEGGLETYVSTRSAFLGYLGDFTDLHTFLFNDAFEIVICKDNATNDTYSKFVKKETRKSKSSTKQLEYIPLC